MSAEDDRLPANRPEGTERAGRRSPIPNARMFVKGQSGNPAGRPKQNYSLVALARQDTVAALQVLRDVMLDPKATASARVTAANAILDRGWGRAPQTLDVTHSVAFGEEWASFMKQLAAKEPQDTPQVIDHVRLEDVGSDLAGRPSEVRPGGDVPDNRAPMAAVGPRNAAAD